METVYNYFDLGAGECMCCGDKTDEIIIETGICIDCTEEQKFYELTMKGL